jgi:hypothetical protein
MLSGGMDSDILIRAINKAIRGGAIAAPPEDALGEDVSYVRTQTNVGIEPAVFDAYVADLKADADMAAFDGTFANVPHGGGVSVSLASIARVLLSRAIATKDVAGTVDRFVSFVANNEATAMATAVMAVSGVKVPAPIKLGPDVSLIPLSALPPSPQRGTALGQSRLTPFNPRFPIPSALTTSFVYRPVFYRPKNPQPPEEMGAHIPTSSAQSLLGEAFDLLSVLSIYPSFRMFWVQPDDWLMSAGMNSGWQYSSEDQLGPEVGVQTKEAEALAAAYFSLDPRKRSKMLRIPLDRLGRAGREQDLADRAIDLGIALESLLLHDIDHGELSFRLSLRGAWLLGSDDTERLKIQTSLKKLYDLRSRAVHSGFVERNANTQNTISRATEICRGLIQKLIALKCNIDWQRVVVGGC